jgi:hypothetical protein
MELFIHGRKFLFEIVDQSRFASLVEPHRDKQALCVEVDTSVRVGVAGRCRTRRESWLMYNTSGSVCVCWGLLMCTMCETSGKQVKKTGGEMMLAKQMQAWRHYKSIYPKPDIGLFKPLIALPLLSFFAHPHHHNTHHTTLHYHAAPTSSTSGNGHLPLWS